MSVAGNPTDNDPSRTTSSRTPEADTTMTATNYTQSTTAHSSDNRSPHKSAKPALNDNGQPTESQPLTAQTSELRDRNTAPAAQERGDSKPHPSRRDSTEGNAHPDLTRPHTPAGLPSQRPPRTLDDSHAALPSAQSPSSLAPADSSDSSLEYYDPDDLTRHEQAEQAKATSRSQPVTTDYAAATGDSSGRQVGLPRDPRPTSHPQSAPHGHRVEMRESQPAQQPRMGSRYITKFFSSSSPSELHDRGNEEYNRMYADIQRAREDLRRLENENRSLRHNIRDIEQDRTRHKENAAALQNELKNVKRELEDSLALSEIRGKELVGAQVFLTKADLLSASELSQKVNALNEENFQLAAWFADSLVHAKPQWKSEEESQGAYKMASAMIGEPAARILLANANEVELNFLFIQLVLQIYFAKWCSIKIERWYEGGPEVNDFLSTIYGELRRTEEQAVSGRWRAITHAHARSSTDRWVAGFTSKLRCLMGIAAWEVSSPEKKSAFTQKLKPVFKAILDIRIALGEHFTSADIEIFCPFAGAPFEPQHMEDALNDGRGKQKDSATASGGGSAGNIIGTSALGLREVRLRGTRNGADEYRIVLPPKVIPQATLQDVLDPPAPSRTKRSKNATHAG